MKAGPEQGLCLIDHSLQARGRVARHYLVPLAELWIYSPRNARIVNLLMLDSFGDHTPTPIIDCHPSLRSMTA